MKPITKDHPPGLYLGEHAAARIALHWNGENLYDASGFPAGIMPERFYVVDRLFRENDEELVKQRSIADAAIDFCLCFSRPPFGDEATQNLFKAVGSIKLPPPPEVGDVWGDPSDTLTWKFVTSVNDNRVLWAMPHLPHHPSCSGGEILPLWLRWASKHKKIGSMKDTSGGVAS